MSPVCDTARSCSGQQAPVLLHIHIVLPVPSTPSALIETLALYAVVFLISAHTIADTNTSLSAVAVRRHIKNLKQYKSEILI